MFERSGWGHLVAWHFLAFALLVALPGLKSHMPFWADDNPEAGAFQLAIAYFAGALVIAALQAIGRRAGVWRAVNVMVCVFCLAFLYFVLTKPMPVVSRSVILTMFIAAIFFAGLGSLRVLRRAGVMLLALALIATLGLEAYRTIGTGHPAMHREEASISTAFYTLKRVTYSDSIARTDVRGGGISRIGDQYLLATGDGRLFVFHLHDGEDAFGIRELPYHVPANFSEFAADANPNGYAGKPNGGDAADRLQGVQTWQFRVADVHVEEHGELVRVFVSHHFWKRADKCFVVRISELSGSRQNFLAGDPALTWRTVFESSPCLPLRGDDSVHENNPFAGMEIGGRIGAFDDQRLLLTLGDHDFTGVETKQMFSQDKSASYGKTLLINLTDGSSEIFTMGHRNPQGLYITPEGTIWSTEHGPQGGDELNLLIKDANYGWPLVTYGTDYGSAAWPLSQNQGRHEGFQKPTFAWVPSIGVSNLVRIEQSRFPVWKGDLMVGSLHAHTLFRLRLEGDRVVYSEPIELGERIRDLVEGHDGRLILWTDTNSIISLSPADGTDGAVIFATTCGGCHKALDGATHSYGPDLAGIVGQRVASAPGFESYSPALKSMSGKWTRERLDSFIASPQTVAPGTAMTFRGVSDAQQRAAILDYLETTRRE